MKIPLFDNFILSHSSLKRFFFLSTTVLKGFITFFLILIINISLCAMVSYFTTSWQSFALVISIVGFFYSLILYNIIYIYWRKIPTSLTSFFWFFIFIMELFMFSYTFYLFIFYKFPNTIYVQDVSIISQYRYVLFLSFSILGGAYLILQYFIPKIKNIANRYTLPYVKEEITKILYTWNNGMIGNFCIFVINKLNDSYFFEKFFFITHFIVFYVTKIIRLGLFIHFCFFDGDLRYLIYFSVISFVVWLLSFIDYYLIWFIKANINMSDDLITVSYTNPELKADSDGYIEVKNTNELLFKLTAQGLRYNFTEQDISDLGHSWCRLNNVLGIFQRYKFVVVYITYFIFISYIFCWMSLVKFFFSERVDSFILFTSPSFFNRLLFGVRQPINGFLFARDARYLPERVQNELRGARPREYSPGHPIYGEESNDEYVVEGSLTRGKGSVENPSEPLLPVPIDSRSQKNGPQNHIPLSKPYKIPVGKTYPPIPGSEQKLQDPKVKEKLDQQHNSDPNNTP